MSFVLLSWRRVQGTSACLHIATRGARVCFFCICVCCGETLWSLLSQLITLQDHTMRCDSAQRSSASGAGILIDVKTTKYLKRWWVMCTEDRISVRQGQPKQRKVHIDIFLNTESSWHVVVWKILLPVHKRKWYNILKTVGASCFSYWLFGHTFIL